MGTGANTDLWSRSDIAYDVTVNVIMKLSVSTIIFISSIMVGY